MANLKSKKGMLIDVQPIKTMEERWEFIEALGMSAHGLRNQLLFKVGISTGLRCGDLVALEVETVRGKTKFDIREGKTKKKRTVHLNTLMADIAEYIEILPENCKCLFPSQKEEYGMHHISTTQAYRILTAAGDLVGNHSIGTHTMRKTFGHIYYNETKDIATLMEIFNHSSQRTTLRYIGYSEEQVGKSISSIRFY
ncbi:tyrosine-type recombinase/integrase [Solibacillus sp. FSL K6-1554]|uniref:tyrosine-type recombinase/integrase n=1 Tax=Solibacillus sp. FSL K6-1554 TaxID=2921472 RepID=UPI0030FB7B0F